MNSAFVPAAPLTARTTQINTCSFAPRAPTTVSQAVRRPSSVRMMADENEEKTSDTGYVIKQSEFVDVTTDDDSGDGFIGEADHDDMLGIAMPEDLASFEMKEIQDSKTKDELVDKLRDIAVRRRGVLDDRRRGMGMDNVGNYLDKL